MVLCLVAELLFGGRLLPVAVFGWQWRFLVSFMLSTMVLVTLVDFDTIFKATMVFWRESCKYHEFLHGGAGDSRSLNSLSVIWPLRRCFSFWHVISLGSFDVLLWLSAVWRQQEQKTCPHDTVTLLFVVEKRAGVRVKFVSWFSPKDVLTCLVWTFCVGLSGALRESAYSKLYLCNFTLSQHTGHFL